MHTQITPEDNVPNLDAMEADDLMIFWRDHQQGRNFREIFPSGGEGTRKATAGLANYAANKATAIYCRLRGNIAEAMEYEKIADRIYMELPTFARY